nr:hypothetical protein [Streptoalloteichus tenebrarius]
MSTTRDPDFWEGMFFATRPSEGAVQWVYSIHAEGGADVIPTLIRSGREDLATQADREAEVAFLGGIAWRFVRSAFELRFENGRWVRTGNTDENPEFSPDDVPAADRRA